MFAIDPYQRLYYEGPSQGAVGIWPPPVVSVATVVENSDHEIQIPDDTNLGSAKLVFREDSFDPVTRIRRGRFYNRGDGAQLREWAVQQHPAFHEEVGRRNHQGYLLKNLYEFHVWAARAAFGPHAPRTLVALGIKSAMTLWRVVGVEQISTGEDLITLKARSNLGLIPDLDMTKIPEVDRARISASASNLVDTAYRAGPESVIDRCRDLAAAALGAFFDTTHPGSRADDLGKLAKRAGETHRYILQNAASLLALLHARCKPNEQVMRGLQPPTEDDASLALECASAVIRELGWQA